MELTEIYDYFKVNQHQEVQSIVTKFGGIIKNGYGITAPELRTLAKKIGKNHSLAIKLWNEDCHDAKLLATLIGDPAQIDENLMDKWIKNFYSWDICDGCIQNLFAYTPFAYKKAIEWAQRKPEYEKRAGFAMMAKLAIGDKKKDDREFENFFKYIIEGSTDERNFVKKAVNWAIRQIGKRSLYLNKKALELARQIHSIDSKSARWIASDAIRELTNEKIIKNIKR
jgi:3-methyladenine DNA glycosylase AlkD